MSRNHTNFLQETVTILDFYKKSPIDVEWVGNTDFYFTWDEFAAVANIEYNSGFGGAEAAEDLKVVGKDFWLERHEYDGSEWWEYKEHPVKPAKHIIPKAVVESQRIGGGWSNDFNALNGLEKENER